MSVVAQPRPRQRATQLRPEVQQQEYGAGLAALSELSALVFAAGAPRDAMRLIASRLCAVLEIERCAIYLRDDPREVFVGSAAHPGGELEAAVCHLTLGGPADRITRELVSTRAPVVIRDARSDPRTQTTAVRTWKLRSMLGIPILSGEHVLGLMMLDNGPDLHRYAPVDIEIATAFAALAASAVTVVRDRHEARRQLEAACRQNKLLRRTTMAEHRLSDAILSGGGLEAIVELVANLTGKPAALYDAHHRPVARHVPGDGDQALGVTLIEDANHDDSVRTFLRETVAGASATIEPVIGTEIRRRHLAAPIDVSGERWGWLVLVEQPTRLNAFDDFLIRRAATHLALELAGRRQATASSADARAQLARQLVRGTTAEDDLRRNAEYLGVKLDAPRVVVYLSAEQGSVDTTALARAVAARTGTEVLLTKGPDAVALLVELGETAAAWPAARAVKTALVAAFGELGALDLTAGVSSGCRSAADIPSGYRVARQVARCLENFAADQPHRVLAADDLGPGRLFVAGAPSEEIERFVEDVLGRLLADEEGCTDLIRTLEAFYDTGRSVRLASERLGIHENTVRYRLSRVHGITGLDVAADADDQLSVQVALLVLRLQGHSALRAFDAPDATELPARAEAGR
jgi:sugar diacid utilization regulator